METVSSVGSVPRLCNWNPRPGETESKESLETAVEVDWTEKRWQERNQAVKRILNVCCSYTETGIITALKSVARIRQVKTTNRNVCNGEL
jgi:hypothetical protein